MLIISRRQFLDEIPHRVFAYEFLIALVYRQVPERGRNRADYSVHLARRKYVICSTHY